MTTGKLDIVSQFLLCSGNLLLCGVCIFRIACSNYAQNIDTNYCFFFTATWAARFSWVPTAAVTVDLPILLVVIVVLPVVITARTAVTWALTCLAPQRGIMIRLLWVTLVSKVCSYVHIFIFNFHSDVVELLSDTPDHSVEIDFWVTMLFLTH